MPLKADTVTKDYVKDAGVFADIFNYYIYGGGRWFCRSILLSVIQLKLPCHMARMALWCPSRDSVMCKNCMRQWQMEYVLYGAENQTEIHYAMAVMNNLYDALEYAGQVEEAAKSHR